MNAHEFTVRLADLLQRERTALADFLVVLADFDRRRLWLHLGHASLFSFLHRELGLSKGAAHYRKTAAELVQRFPDVIEPIREGKLCITSIVELAKVLSPENREDVLPRFFHLSKREAAEVAAAIRPHEAAPRREVVTTLRLAPPVPPPYVNRTIAPPGPAETATQSVQPEGHLDANSGSPAAVSAPQPQEGPGATQQAPTEPAPLHLARDVTEHPAADLRALHSTGDVEPFTADLRPPAPPATSPSRSPPISDDST